MHSYTMQKLAIFLLAWDQAIILERHWGIVYSPLFVQKAFQGDLCSLVSWASTLLMLTDVEAQQLAMSITAAKSEDSCLYLEPMSQCLSRTLQQTRL